MTADHAHVAFTFGQDVLGLLWQSDHELEYEAFLRKRLFH